MIKTTLSFIPNGEPWPRQYVQTLVETALSANASQFARKLSQAWLENFPGDLTFQYLLAKSWLAQNRLNKATETIQKVVDTDPEYLAAQRFYRRLLSDLQHPSLPLTSGNIYALTGNYKGKFKLPKWSEHLIYARRALNQKDFELAERLTYEVLAQDPPSPLGAITHLRAMLGSGDNSHPAPMQAIRKITEHYRKKWPSCLFFDLVLIDTLIDAGEEEKGVSLLHYAASRDVNAQVAKSLWGNHHPYLDIWPKKLEAIFDIAIPADVATLLGWNQLPQGKTTDKEKVTFVTEASPVKKNLTFSFTKLDLTKTQHESEAHKSKAIKSIEKEFSKVANRIKQPHLAKADGRYPVYVVFTTKQGLIAKYGVDTTETIHRELQKMVFTIREKENWGAVLVYADDPICMSSFNLKPAKANDPWNLKLTIRELDDRLGEKGSMIGTMLIVGGPDIVPYHMLPNPTDDSDAAIPSDNPYATKDENYFIPEWPIGRIPDGKENDPGLLISTIRRITKYHRTQNKTKERPIKSWIEHILALFKGKQELFKKREPFGFSAEAWLKATVSVYRTIGKPEEIVTSPPNELFQGEMLSPFHLGYFNLHGLPDAPEWYGQSDPVVNNGELFYPIAISPSAITINRGTNGHKPTVPDIIFTEACYGAHIIEKGIDESMALKFLLAGTKTFIGSTATAYGSIDMNLTSADLLAKTFWRLVKEGYTTGEALHRAKIYYAQEMHKRNNYLDGEDQKTLISFIHLGDPLYISPAYKKKHAKLIEKQADMGILREAKPLNNVNTVCDNCDTWVDNDILQSDVMAKVKSIVEQYLPTMSGAKISIHKEEFTIQSAIYKQGETSNTEKSIFSRNKVIILSKQVKQSQHIHNSYARLTINEKGKIIKMTVSR